jgi:hypothetical protein
MAIGRKCERRLHDQRCLAKPTEAAAGLKPWTSARGIGLAYWFELLFRSLGRNGHGAGLGPARVWHGRAWRRSFGHLPLDQRGACDVRKTETRPRPAFNKADAAKDLQENEINQDGLLRREG